MVDPPAPGFPWDAPVDRAPLVFVDLEMTGLDPARDRVVEVCAERVVGGQVVGRFHSLVDPGDAAGGAACVHGLDAAALSGAPVFGCIAAPLAEVLRGAVFVAHGAKWDVAFLRAEYARAGVPFALDHWVDTLHLARRAFAFHGYSLDALAIELAIDRGRAHRADSDVRATRALFDRCVAVLAPVSVRDLWEVRVGERRARSSVVQASLAAVSQRKPVVVTYRAARRPPEPMTMVLLEVRADLDPPRVVGYQLPGRGRRQLRADRILRIEPAPESAEP